MKMALRRYFPFWILAVFFLSGCAPFKAWLIEQVERPQITRAEVRLEGLTKEGLSLKLALSLMNPNSFDLRAEELAYVLSIEDQEVAWGHKKDPVHLPPRETASLDLPLKVGFLELGMGLVSLRIPPPWKYRVQGSVTFKFWGKLIRVPFDHTGTWRPV
jgi:LEA14-like dessication related protein